MRTTHNGRHSKPYIFCAQRSEGQRFIHIKGVSISTVRCAGPVKGQLALIHRKAGSSMSSPIEIEISETGEQTAPAAWLISLSLGSSLMIHLTGLALLAVLILPGGGRSESLAISGSLVDTVLGEGGGSFGDSVAFLDGGSLMPESEAAPAPKADLLLPAMDLAMTSAEIAPQQPAELDASLPTMKEAAIGGMSEVVGTGTRAGSSAGTGTSGGKGRGSGRGAASGFGSGSGTGMGSGTGSGIGRGKGGFFGLKVKGKSTVFVVDASRSMNLPHPGPSHTRFNRVKLELVRTISSMSENERFFIIFFGDQAYPMPANRMMEAEAPARRRFLSWMQGCQAVGRTFPQQALLLALQLEPDQVYFLTDGEFDYNVVPTVTAANSEGVPIHTIGFSDDRGENLLLEIARRNKGTYTYIPPDEPGDDGMADPSQPDMGQPDPSQSAMSLIAPLGK